MSGLYGKHSHYASYVLDLELSARFRWLSERKDEASNGEEKRLLGHKERVITCVVLGQLPTSTMLHEPDSTTPLARITNSTS
jgi:hypothetical protein